MCDQQCLSCLTHLFNCVRSTQICTLLFGLGTTIPALQSVGPSTLEMIFSYSILSSSFAMSGSVSRAKGVTLSDSLMSYSPCNFPKPVKSSGNLETTTSLSNLTSQILLRLVINSKQFQQWCVKVLHNIDLFFYSMSVFSQCSRKLFTNLQRGFAWSLESS